MDKKPEVKKAKKESGVVKAASAPKEPTVIDVCKPCRYTKGKSPSCITCVEYKK